MANMSVSEKDFMVVAAAAMDAQDAGNSEAARSLDQIARKMNLALSMDGGSRKMAAFMSGNAAPKRTWRDMPSVLVKL